MRRAGLLHRVFAVLPHLKLVIFLNIQLLIRVNITNILSTSENKFYINMFFCWTFLVCLFIHYCITVMTMNQHNKISPASLLNNLSTIKYNNRHSNNKTKMRKVQESSGKVQEGRKTITEINRVYSQILPITLVNRAKNYQNMASKGKETEQKIGYNLLGSKIITEKSESEIASQKENKLLTLRNKREAEYFLSISEREAKSKTNKNSSLGLEESTLKYEKTIQIISNSASNYNLTTVQDILITNALSNSDPMSETQGILDVSQKEIWFVSDEGSDRYNCQTESTPCKNLQTVLDRASDGAEIYVTSQTISLDLVNDTVWYKIAFWSWTETESSCLINSSLSYTLRSISETKTNITCSSKYFAIKPI